MGMDVQKRKNNVQVDDPCAHSDQSACPSCASKRRYREKNRDRLRSASRKRYSLFTSNQRSAHRKMGKEWRNVNRDRARFLCRRQQRNWTENQKQQKRDRQNLAYAVNPEPRRDKSRLRHALSRGADPSKSVIVNPEEIWYRDEGICGICGDPVSLEKAELDHIVPTSWGGPHTSENCQTSHKGCNAGKRDRSSIRVLGPVGG